MMRSFRAITMQVYTLSILIIVTYNVPFPLLTGHRGYVKSSLSCVCLICYSTLETIFHAIQDYQSSKEALDMVSMPLVVNNSSVTSTLAWLEEAASSFSIDASASLLVVLWNFWN
ncbi:hypothetical protein V6N11_051756 [Hibiscus sabdariffa]|uniref:Uncharacterized protein n=1 Tax=Hibiscus sabdariffa TaxID=183260 RepID=A0ABR2U806_9ROSI